MKPTYLVVGNLTRDVQDVATGAFTLGGTASYASLTARSCGCDVALLTRADDGLEAQAELPRVLAGVRLFRQAAAHSTTFRNRYANGEREQLLHASAGAIAPAALPPPWDRPAIVHLGPVFQEIDATLVEHFAAGGAPLVAITPQGCLRGRDETTGRVRPTAWHEAEAVLARCRVVVISVEDVGGDLARVEDYARQVEVLVLTAGWRGATVYCHGEVRFFAAPEVREVDPTGAGDIFAAAYLVSLQQQGDPWCAARFANCVAADSVTRRGLAGVPTAERVARCSAAAGR